MNINRMKRRAASFRFWGWTIRILTILSFIITAVIVFVPAFFGSASLGIIGTEIASGNMFEQQMADEALLQIGYVSVGIGLVIVFLQTFPHLLFWFLSVYLMGKADDIQERIELYQMQSGRGRPARQPSPDPISGFPPEIYDDPPSPKRRQAMQRNPKASTDMISRALRRRLPEVPDKPQPKFIYDEDYDDYDY